MIEWSRADVSPAQKYFYIDFSFYSLWSLKKKSSENWRFQFCCCEHFQSTEREWQLTVDDVLIAQDDFCKAKL